MSRAYSRVGLVSDTHGLLRAEVLEALQDVDHVLHAGDVGRPELLDELRRLAPLTAVRGNVDRGAWAERLPWTAELKVAGYWFHVRHILDELDLDPRAAGFDFVVYGHSHMPQVIGRDGVTYINPGSAGPRRFKLPISLGLLDLGVGDPRLRLLELRDGPRRGESVWITASRWP